MYEQIKSALEDTCTITLNNLNKKRVINKAVYKCTISVSTSLCRVLINKVHVRVMVVPQAPDAIRAPPGVNAQCCATSVLP